MGRSAADLSEGRNRSREVLALEVGDGLERRRPGLQCGEPESGYADALDAGYFVETLRQASFVYRYDMLSPKERAEWKLRGEGGSLDGYAWVQKAIRLGGKDMERAASLMVEYRKADLQSRASN